MGVAGGDLFEEFGDLLVILFGAGVIGLCHPVQMAKAQQVQKFVLGPQALELFFLQVGGIREAHDKPPCRAAGEVN